MRVPLLCLLMISVPATAALTRASEIEFQAEAETAAPLDSDFGFEPTEVRYVQNAIQLVNAELPTEPVVDSHRLIQQLQAEVAELKSEVRQAQYSPPIEYPAAMIPQSGLTGGCCSECGEGQSCRCNKARSPRLFASVEVPFLLPRISGAFPVFNVSPAADRLIDSGFSPSVRYSAEYRPEPTLGIRGRYFTLDRNSPFGDPFKPAAFGIRLDTADLEFVFHQSFCRWNIDLSAGAEYSRLEYAADVPTAVGVGSVRFEGVGPVFGLNAEHRLGQSNLFLFGGVRASYLMGDIRNSSLLVNMPRSTIHSEIMQIYQNQLGMVWKPEVFDSLGITVKAGWETQFLMNDTFADDSYGIGSNLSLTGPMVSAEVNY